MKRLLVCLLLASVVGSGSDAVLAADESAAKVVDVKTLHHKVLCGYQGWFRCPGDKSEQGWKHWSRNARTIHPSSLTFEMWPDLDDFTREEKYLVPGFTSPGGQPAYLFSSANEKTVMRHFRWMQQYGIDGVFAQRFLVNTRDPSFDQVLRNIRVAANQTGRAFALCYDMSGTPQEQIFDQLVSDWKRQVDEMKITRDPRYLHHEGKPVLMVWGFFEDRFGPALAHRIIDFFKKDPQYSVTLVGGCQWYWRIPGKQLNAEWARAFRRFDVISPWNVGNVSIAGDTKSATTAIWKEDLVEAKKAGMSFLPVIYPGFGWTNLKGPQATAVTIPRRGGTFFWEQFATATELGVEMAYIAMFDEVDEATAIFKVSNMPPRPGRFSTYEGLPTDWYLRLTGEGSKMIRGERPKQRTIPITP